VSENILEKIVARKREAVTRQKEAVLQRVVQAVLDKKFQPALFQEALLKDSRHLIAEVKKASPSAGVIREDFDGVALARAYEKGGATAISVVTEEEFFQGSLALFDDIRAAVKVPLLRKDFVIDTYQIYESKLHGADAVLLMASILPGGTLSQFVNLCRRLELDALVEVHDTRDLSKARDLTDFSVRLETLPSLVARIPSSCTVVCESGVKDTKDLEFVKEISRVRAVLVGEALMRADDPEKKVREFIWMLTQ